MYDSDWYYSIDGTERLGPVDVDGLQSVFSEAIRGGRNIELSRVWNPRLQAWRSPAEIDELQGVIPINPYPGYAAGVGQTTLPLGSAARSEEFLQGNYSSGPHPWRRFLARQIDYLLFSFCVGICVGVAVALIRTPTTMFLSTLISNPMLSAMPISILWIPFEAMFIGLFGATPGKAIFGVSVTTPEGNTIGVGGGFRRAGAVCLRGIGLGIPLISLCTEVRGYNNLVAGNPATWDRNANIVTNHKRWGFFRAAFCTLFIGGLIIGLVTLAARTHP